MAGRGPAPKPASQRRNRHEPRRGEWVDLEPLAEPVLPEHDDDWSERVKRLWVAWRSDPVSSQYSEGDIAALWEFASTFERLQPSEQRLRMDGFGLTPKGKRDLRWRVPQDAQRQAEEASRPRLAEVRRLRAIDAAG